VFSPQQWRAIRRTWDHVRRSSTHYSVASVVRTPGGQLLWQNAPYARDLRIETVVPLRIGSMTESHADSQIPATSVEA
jgi:hypothetical protein